MSKVTNTLYSFCSRSFSCFRNNTHKIINNPISNVQIYEPQVSIIEWKDTIPFIPPVNGGEVIKVYDGDTITIATKLPFDNSPLYRFPVRLHGIDAPEIKGKNEDEKRAAKASQKALADLILHKNVTLKNVTTEKYGRILANVFFEDINISEWMLKNNLAVPYDGGTKKSPESWLDYQETGTTQ